MRFKEMTEASFQEAIEREAAGGRHHRTSYESREPARMVEEFFKLRGAGDAEEGVRARA